MGLLGYISAASSAATSTAAGGAAADAESNSEGATTATRTRMANASTESHVAAATAGKEKEDDKKCMSATALAHSSTTIRHAGRAHVRGKIRRLWRPRYLQLQEDGLVNYYEVTRDNEHLVLKYVLEIRQARLLSMDGAAAVTASASDKHVGLPCGMYGFCLQGKRVVAPAAVGRSTQEQQSTTTTTYGVFTAAAATNCSDQAAEDWRDVYCAVDTLEEAQMWVVALQWAASVRAKNQQQQQDPQAQEQQPEDWTKVGMLDKKKKHAATVALASSLPVTAATKKKKASASKIVVAKVVQYQIVRVDVYQFEIAYEIHCLLLDQDKAEQWSILRTANDLEQLVENMCEELGPTILDPAQLGPIRSLPRLTAKPHLSEIQRSLSVADSILRSLIMDAAMLNSRYIKPFLGLSTSSTKSAGNIEATFLSMLPAVIHLHDSKMISNRITEAVTMPTDQYVKKWFSCHATKKQQSIVTVYMTRFFQQPLAIVGGVGVGAVAFKSLAFLWERMVAPTISVRMDFLVLSWLSAAYLGHCIPLSRLTGSLPLVVDKEGSVTASTTLPVTDAGKSAGSMGSKTDSATNLDDGVLVGNDSDASLSTVSVRSEEGEEMLEGTRVHDCSEGRLSSPLPRYPDNDGVSCWSPVVDTIFNVRGESYFMDRVKLPSDPSPLTCRGVDIFLTDTPQRHIARHPSVLGGKLDEEDTFLVNFLLPFGNFVAYFSIPPLTKFPKKLRNVWSKFLRGDQEYRDARLKLLPVVVEGPWIVKTAVGPGNSPALLGKVIPLQYFFREPCSRNNTAAYEVDVIITASTLAKGVLSVVKGSSSSVSIAFAFIIEAAEQEELPETVLCSFQLHSICLDDCPVLPPFEDVEDDSHSI